MFINLAFFFLNSGKYVPAISYKIHQMNSMPDTEMKMPLKGLAIGDGLCDPLHQMDYGDFLYQVGLLDESDRTEVDKHADLAKISMELEQWHQATTVSVNHQIFFLSVFQFSLLVIHNWVGTFFYPNHKQLNFSRYISLNLALPPPPPIFGAQKREQKYIIYYY
jgi:hypothetical protein